MVEVLNFYTGVIVTLSTVILLLYVHFKKKLSYWKEKGVPYMEPDIIFGNFRKMLFLQRSIQHSLIDFYNAGKGNKIFGFYIFHRPALLIRDPDYIRQILIKDFNYFLDRQVTTNETKDPLGYKSLFVIKGQPWRELRVKLTPIFTSGKMKNMFPLICECATNLQEYFRKNVKGGSYEVECREIMSKMTTDIISSCAFGIQANSLADENAELRKYGRTNFEFTNWRAIEFLISFMLPRVAKLGITSFFAQPLSKKLREVMWDVMDAREKSKAKRNDLIDLLIQLKNTGNITDEGLENTEKNNSSNSFAFEGDNLLAQAAVFFVAGFETNASALTFVQYELAMKQDIQNRLRDEITSVLEKHNGKITYNAIQDMPYMDMVVSETLRKYLPFGFLDRVAMKDYVIPGTSIVIEKGTPVFVPVHALHLDPEYFPDPDTFDPERFNEENKKNIRPYTYMPFGEGPHNCIGSRFALVVIKCALCHIVSQYLIQPCKDTPQTITYDPKAIILFTEGIKLKYTILQA